MIKIIESSVFGAEKDKEFMQEALQLATSALENNEVPIGAVVVSAQGEIIATAGNKVEQDNTQLAHAECLAIAQAGKAINDWRLDGCWIYVTLEPCAMCMHLIRLSRLAGLVYGSPSPLFGFSLDNMGEYRVYKKDTFVIVSGVCNEEGATLLKQFFKNVRGGKRE